MLRASIGAAAILATASVVSAQQSAPQLRQLMSATEFREAGLDKLNADELAKLDAWLLSYGRAVWQIASATSAQSSASATIESRIDGDFNGWEGETIFKLQNGQIWQQASYAYRYHYAYAPKVLIYSSGSGYMMRVDGIDQAIAVKRLK
jgi:hypothetical protein